MGKTECNWFNGNGKRLDIKRMETSTSQIPNMMIRTQLGKQTLTILRKVICEPIWEMHNNILTQTGNPRS